MRHLYICFWAAAAMAGQNDIATLKQQGAYDSLSAAYTAAIYGIEPARGGGYQAWNARQEITARFRPDGFQVESTNGSVGLRLAGWGYGSALSPAIAPQLVVSGKRIEYRRGALVEWYVNEAAGLEQVNS